MLAVSTLNTISSLISKALTDDSISDEEYLLILLEFETFTRIKEDLRIKSKTSLEKTGNIENEGSVLFNRNSTTSPAHLDYRNLLLQDLQMIKFSPMGIMIIMLK